MNTSNQTFTKLFDRFFPIGTRTVLVGAHCFWIHPWFVLLAWWRLFGFPRDPRLWIAFVLHDLGYWGKPNLDGDEGERHVEWAAQWMHRHFDFHASPVQIDCLSKGYADEIEDSLEWAGVRVGRSGTTVKFDQMVETFEWRDFCLYHSRFYARRDGVKVSRLCLADKLAVALEPWWIYLPRVFLSGEIHEYMARAGGTEDSKYNGEPVVSKYLSMGVCNRTPRQWHSDMTEYLRKWVEEHRDGREDTWTPAPQGEEAHG